MPAIQRLRLKFPGEGAECRAELLWDAAPNTCAAIAERLPISAPAHQAIYSGSETVLLLPEVLRLPAEHATSEVARGDVAFAWFAAGSGYGVDSDFAELCWFYDIDARPCMWEGPVPVNVFARIQEPAADFYAVCRRIRREGVKPVIVERWAE